MHQIVHRGKITGRTHSTVDGSNVRSLAAEFAKEERTTERRTVSRCKFSLDRWMVTPFAHMMLLLNATRLDDAAPLFGGAFNLPWFYIPRCSNFVRSEGTRSRQ